MGYTRDDITQVSDRIVDDLIVWGSPGTIAGRLRELLQAGADHVVLHVLSEPGQPGPAEVAQNLAGLLPSRARHPR
jgi:hypothetical protein